MLKEAIEKIESMSSPKPFEVDGKTYIFADGNIHLVREPIDEPEELVVYSLNALEELVRNDTGDIRTLFVSVEAYNRVRVYTDVEEDDRWTRKHLYTAKAADVPGWEPKIEMPFDEATVALMTRFQDSADKEYTLRLLSQITTGAKVTYTDNGVASTIVSQRGAALAENVTIKPIVRLRPYRTFQEVEQPEGLFLIRVRERGVVLIEADGGMWKLTARNTIKAWLAERLKDVDAVVVML